MPEYVSVNPISSISLSLRNAEGRYEKSIEDLITCKLVACLEEIFCTAFEFVVQQP